MNFVRRPRNSKPVSSRLRNRRERRLRCCFFNPAPGHGLGFEAATVALGAHSIGMEDMSASRTNARTGELLEDCAAVISRLCDAIVVRHHENGAADRMAAKSQTPVINAGDGWNEHPTQALIDIFALRRGLGTIARQKHRVRRRSEGAHGSLADPAAAVRSAEGNRVLPDAALRRAGRYLVGDRGKSNSAAASFRTSNTR